MKFIYALMCLLLVVEVVVQVKGETKVYLEQENPAPKLMKNSRQKRGLLQKILFLNALRFQIPGIPIVG